MKNEKQCCTPEGQVPRYVDCVGCDQKPMNKPEWSPSQGEIVWIKVFSNWSKGTYIGYDVIKNQHLVREAEEGGGHLLISANVLPENANPNEPKSDKKQSSIDWLLSQFEEYGYDGVVLENVVKQTRAMHKEEQRKTYLHHLSGVTRDIAEENFEQYYNETFKSNNG